MSIFGLEITLTGILSVGGIVVAMVTGWFKINEKVTNNTNLIVEMKKDVGILENKVYEQERQASVVNAHLTTIQAQMTTVQQILDTILSYLLSLKEK